MVDEPAHAVLPIKVLLDTNVVLDLLLERQPWLQEARPMWDAYNAGTIIACVNAATITDIFYVCRKLVGVRQARHAVTRCVQSFHLLPVTEAIVTKALTLAGPDFEDDVQIACAWAAGMNAIVTRNLAQFSHSPVATIAPHEVPARLQPPTS
jgi:predicted nucleic acid-binding protein